MFLWNQGNKDFVFVYSYLLKPDNFFLAAWAAVMLSQWGLCTGDGHMTNVTDPFHKWFMHSWLQLPQDSFSSNSYFDNSIRFQFCTCHDSSAVMACAKLWPDLIIKFHKRARQIFTRYGLWAHKPLVKRVPGPNSHQTMMKCNIINHSHISTKQINSLVN